mgnify:CR=1 FL=1
MEYFNRATKHISYEEKKVILNGILNDLPIKDIIGVDNLNEFITNVLVIIS